MKLHSLTVENLNSLRGLHHIDFEHLFDASTVLLIAGETGAGKSTILDAIVLALFGSTPRLRGVAKSTSKDMNILQASVLHVMTRGTGECRAVLDFSILSERGQRERYRATWKLQRAFKKVDGAIQNATQEFERWDDARAGWVNVLAAGEFSSFTSARDHALRGMSREDFLRSVMLAQGQFDVLLSADATKRAEALRRVVPVENIQAIGHRVAENASAARAALQTLKAQVEGEAKGLLSDEERLKFQEERAAAERAVEEQQQQVEALRLRVSWSETQVGLSEERAMTAAAWERATADKIAQADKARALQEHRRVEEAFRAIVGLQNVRKQQQTHATALQELVERVETTKKLSAPLIERSAELLTREQTLLAAREERAPLLEAAQQAWDARLSAKSVEQQAQAEAQRLAKAYEESNAALAERKATAEKLKADAEAQQKVVADYALSNGAVSELPRAEALVEQLHEGLRVLKGAQDLAEAEAQKLRSVEAQLNAQREAGTTLEKVKEQWFEELGEVCASANLEHVDPTDLAASRDVEQLLTERRDELTDRGIQLRGLKEHAVEAQKQATMLASLHDRLNQAKPILEQLESDRVRLDKESSTQAQLITSLTSHRATQSKFLELVAQLQPGVDCPFCGSNQHGSTDERHATMQEEAAETARELVAAQAAAEVIEQQRAALRADWTAKNDAWIRLETEVKQTELQHAETTRLLHEIAREIPAPYAEEPGVVNFDPLALEALLIPMRDQRSELNTFIKKAQELAKRAESIRVDAAAQDARLKGLLEQQKQGAAQVKLAKEKEEQLEKRLADAHTAVHNFFDSVDFLRWKPTPNDNLILSAQAAHAAVRECIGTLKSFERDLQLSTQQQERRNTAAVEVERQEAIVKQHFEASAQAATQLAAASEAYTKAVAASEACFGGEDPRLVRERFEEELRAAQIAHRKAQQAVEEALIKQREAQTAKTAQEAVLEQTNLALAEQDRALKLLLLQVELPDEAAVMARRLSEDVALAYDHAVQQAEAALQSADQRLKDATQRLEAHQLKLESIGEPQADDSDNFQALRASTDALRERCTELRVILENDEKLTKNLAESKGALDQKTKERDEWEILSSIVGRNKGAAFSDFALALSLGDLIRHANQQLEHIAPRYVLRQRFSAEGAPEIEFEVMDRHFSDEVRPVTNISGGERFQLSLAMALGLASMSRSVLPVETLLIDEGFGTLDPETLDKAIQTLESLYQRTGARVALISHVERLRERLPTQILVKKRGGGHSSLDIRDGMLG